MDCSLPDSSIHRISQARILEWLAISYSRSSSDPGSNCCHWCLYVSCFGRQNEFFTTEPPGNIRQKLIQGQLVAMQEIRLGYNYKETSYWACLSELICICNHHDFFLINKFRLVSHVNKIKIEDVFIFFFLN